MEEVLAMDSINREGYRDGDNGGQKDNRPPRCESA